MMDFVTQNAKRDTTFVGTYFMADNIERSIGRTIINHQTLYPHIGIFLCKDRFQTTLDSLLVVVGRKNDGNIWHFSESTLFYHVSIVQRYIIFMNQQNFRLFFTGK
jgi:hypothetical protein